MHTESTKKGLLDVPTVYLAFPRLINAENELMLKMNRKLSESTNLTFI